jgi:PST family polysaccharide transporter
LSTAPKSFRIAFGWSLVQHWGARAISFLVFFVLARLLSPSDFGLVALSSIVIGFTEIFIDQGFSDAVVQSHDDSEQYLSTAFWVNIFTALALMLVVLFGANSIASVFKEPRLVLITRVLSITFLFTALSSVQIALLRRKLDYRSLAIRTTLANLISGTVAITMALVGFGVWSLVVQQIVFGAVSMIVVWRVGVFRLSRQVDWASFRQLMHFGLKVCGVRTVDLLHTKLIDSLVGIYLGAVVLGIYAVGTRLGLILMQLLGTSIADVSLAHFSDLRRAGGDISAAYLKMLRRLALTSVPLFTYLALESRPLVHILFGHKWDDSAPIFAAFCGAGIVQVLIYFSNSAISALGRPGLQLVMSLIKLALYVGGFYIYVSHGIAAIAWSMTGVTVLVIAPISFAIVGRLLRFPMAALVRRLLLPYSCVSVAAAMAYMTARYCPPLSVLSLIASTVAFFGTFLACCLATDPDARALGFRLLRTKV